MKTVEALVRDKKREDINWAICKTGVLMDMSVLQHIDFDTLTSNQ